MANLSFSARARSFRRKAKVVRVLPLLGVHRYVRASAVVRIQRAPELQARVRSVSVRDFRLRLLLRVSVRRDVLHVRERGTFRVA